MGKSRTSAELKKRALRKSVRIYPLGASIYCSWNFDSLATPDYKFPSLALAPALSAVAANSFKLGETLTYKKRLASWTSASKQE